jgi:hypothetical protein
MKEIIFRVADCDILVRSNTDFGLEEGYLPYVVEEESISINPEANEADGKPEIVIEAIHGIPGDLLKGKQLLFDAENEQQKFYSIYQMPEGLGFAIYNQQTHSDIQQVAILSADYSHWTLYYDANGQDAYPLKYPFGPIMLHYLTLKVDAVMMHASCAFDGRKGRMFTGFSGVGKSTMSKLWAQDGSRIINDDRLIIRRWGEIYKVYNTPMYYQDIPKVARLDGIFLIRHYPENHIRRVKGAMAVSKVMAFSIQNNFDSHYVAQRLAFFSELSARVPVYELGFVPDATVVDFIRQHEEQD